MVAYRSVGSGRTTWGAVQRIATALGVYVATLAKAAEKFFSTPGYSPRMIWPTRERSKPTSSPMSRSESPAFCACANALRRASRAALLSRSTAFGPL